MAEEDHKNERYDLGVLLVHGIGQQARGDTLIKCGDAMQSWLERWIARESAPKAGAFAPVVKARFTAPADDAGAPGHAELQLKTDAENDRTPARWLFAESWWASTFLPPSYRELAVWGVQILPWTLVTHFATRARRVLHNLLAASGWKRIVAAGRLAPEILGFLLTLVLVPLLVTLLILVLLVGILPIPAVRSFVGRLQRSLSGTLGDSFVLIVSPIQEAAIVGRVEHDLQWLAAQGCRCIAVVAHSQGAAIAHKVFKRPGFGKQAAEGQPDTDPDQRWLFVSVGSGLNKLAEIRGIRNTGTPALIWTAPVGLLILALASPELYASIRNDTDNFLPFYVGIAGLFLFFVGVAAAWKENRPRIEDLELGVPWLDFYASADPVPNGPMFDSSDDTQRLMQARKVHNLASSLFDHVTYWRNADDFLVQLACALEKHGALQLCKRESMDRSHLEVAPQRRRWRVGWLVAARVLILMLTAVLGIRYWSELPTATSEVLQALAPLLKWIPGTRDYVQTLRDIDIASQVAAAGALALFGIATYYALYGTWSIWNKSDVASFFERKQFAAASTSFLGFVFLLIAVVETFVLAIAGRGDGLLAGLIAATMTWILAVIIVSLLMGTVGLIVAFLYQVWTVVRSLLGPIAEIVRRNPKADTPQKVAPQRPLPEDKSTRRLIDWREPQNGRRVWLSLVALILLTFPYEAFVAAEIPPGDLWVEGWWWRIRLLNAIEAKSSAFTISQWQWLLGAFIMVVSVNATAASGGLRRVGRCFADAAHAGPIAVAHANQLSAQDGAKVLTQAASLVGQEYAKWESLLLQLRAEEARSPDSKGEISVPRGRGHISSGAGLEHKLRDSARVASQIAARMDENDLDACALLERVARTSPEAALTLVERIGRTRPDTVVQHLDRHADQPGWLLRLRVRRGLARVRRYAQELGTAV